MYLINKTEEQIAEAAKKKFSLEDNWERVSIDWQDSEATLDWLIDLAYFACYHEMQL